MINKQEFIKNAMKKLGCRNQSDFATIVGCNQVTVSRWLSGKREPSIMVIKLITKLLMEVE